jgi:hypothetical protein
MMTGAKCQGNFTPPTYSVDMTTKTLIHTTYSVSITLRRCNKNGDGLPQK